MSEATQPTIFIPMPREGEKHLCSIITQKDGKPVICHSFLLPDRDKLSWKKGMEWAKNLGGDLLDRVEQAIAYRDIPEEFDKAAHWSNTQHADISNYAWCQGFLNGTQGSSLKLNEFLVRAVRREFSDLVI